MRIDVRKRWKCIAWTGPHEEQGHGLWLPLEYFAQDEDWCAGMDALYPGWRHTIVERLGTPPERSPEGLDLHPFYGDMQHGPLGL